MDRLHFFPMKIQRKPSDLIFPFLYLIVSYCLHYCTSCIWSSSWPGNNLEAVQSLDSFCFACENASGGPPLGVSPPPAHTRQTSSSARLGTGLSLLLWLKGLYSDERSDIFFQSESTDSGGKGGMRGLNSKGKNTIKITTLKTSNWFHLCPFPTYFALLLHAWSQMCSVSAAPRDHRFFEN